MKALMPDGYQPEPLTDFSKPENQERMQKAILKVSDERGKKYPLLIGERKVWTKNFIVSENPANFAAGYTLGYVAQARKESAAIAMFMAQDAFEIWSKTPVQERAAILLDASDIIRQERFELAALMVLEASKTWREANADVAEAIDFLEYYARMEAELMPFSPTEKLAAESNEYGYAGRGVSVVISPWNFPMAIATGMCAAALAAAH